MTSNEELEKRLASNIRVSHSRAVRALQKSDYDYSKAVDYIISGQEASELILSAVVRSDNDASTSTTPSRRRSADKESSSSGSFGKKTFSSMLNFTSLSLSREKSKDNASTPAADDDDQPTSSNKPFYYGRALSLTRSCSREESSAKEKDKEKERSSRSRTRSTSPPRRKGKAPSLRDPSPAVEALRMSQSDVELSDAEDAASQYSSNTLTSSGTGQHRKRRPWGIVPRRSSFWKSGSDSESSSSSSEDESDDDTIRSPPEWDANQGDDFNLSSTSLGSVELLTEENTEKNAMLGFNEDGEPLYLTEDGDVFDPLGEGINIVRPNEPVFGPQPATKAGAGPSASASGHRRTPTRKETSRSTRVPLDTSKPSFSRDRCILTLTHGDPTGYLRDAAKEGDGAREPKQYVIASDLSTESGYAVEWGIGTVLRDGDTMILVSVQETDTKLDPEPNAPSIDRVQKLRNQQERHALATLLARQVTGLLQRTKLQCTVICFAAHAKNSRRFLLDLIDYIEPTMVIVGSRGRGRLKGILLGSTSHYLIQKSSVPVMVARRRLRRPARRTAHLTLQRPQPGSTRLQGGRSKLTEALIDKAGPGKVDHDVEHMREELQREETEEVASRSATTKRSGLREGVGDLGVQGGVGGAME